MSTTQHKNPIQHIYTHIIDMDITDTKIGTCVTEYHSSYAHTVWLAHSRDDHYIISFMSLECHVLS